MRTWKWIIIPILVLAVTSACGMTKQQGMNVKQNVNRTDSLIGQDTGQVLPDLLNDDKAQHLVNIALSVPQVNHAYCLTLGNMAIVGIDVPADMERSRVDIIKYSVAEAMKKDPYGANALVTADLDLTQNIREISTKINEGHPITAFTSELGDILGRLIPQLPQDTLNVNPPAPQDQANPELKDNVSNRQAPAGR